MPASKQRSTRPQAGLPNMPGYGINEDRKDLLPWKWAEEQLTNTRNYYLTTVRQGRRPHVMPIWGVWFADLFYFSTGKTSVKARNMALNPKVVLCAGNAGEAVIVEGNAAPVSDNKILKLFAKHYFDKYTWDVSEMNEPVFSLRPRVAFGQIEKTYTQTATRWIFES